MLNGITVDFRFATRRLLASPLFTIFAVLSLAAGVSITTAVYSVVDAIFLNDDFGIRDQDRVAFVVDARDGQFQRSLLSQEDFDAVHASQRAFSSFSGSTPIALTVTTPLMSESIAVELVEPGYFAVLGANMRFGRAIQSIDDEAGERVAVLSERFWRRRFGASRDVVGQQILVAGQSFDIIGIARAPFEGAAPSLPGMGTNVWLPRVTRLALGIAQAPAGRGLQFKGLLAFGRLDPKATPAAASSEMATIASRLDVTSPSLSLQRGGVTERPWKARTAAAIASEDSPLRQFGLILVGLVGMVLIVACTNLANLVISRGVGRRQEFAVRSALGASRWRLVREQAVESLLIAIVGAGASYLAFQGLSIILNADFNLPLPMASHWTISIRPSLNRDALLMAGVGLLLSLVVFGLEPAIQLTRTLRLASELAASGGSIGDLKAPRQRALLRWQVAVSAGFFIIATMFVKFTVEEARHDSGVALDRIAIAMLNPVAPGWDNARRARAVERVLRAAPETSQSAAIAASAGLPFGAADPIWLTLRVPGEPANAVRSTGMAATPSIFRALDVPILRGRSFDDRDHAASMPVALLSEFTARRLFGTGDSVGRQVVVQGQGGAVTVTVVGIARDTDVRRMLGEPAPFVYLPLAQRTEVATTIVARGPDATASLKMLSESIRRAEPLLPVQVIGTGRSVLAGPFQVLRSAGIGSIGLGMLTLFLAMVGLFGIESQIVSRRTREIGVRIAFGATRSQIQRMVLKDGYRPVVEGLCIGLFIGLAGRAIVRSYLELDISIVDPWILLIVPIPLILAACFACYFPARRASTIDPNVALRHL